MSVYLYWGDEDFNIELAVKNLRKRILNPEWVAFNHKKLNSPSIQELIEACTTVPFGFGDVLVEVQNLNFFSRKTKTKTEDDLEEQNNDKKLDDKETKAFLELIENLPERINLLFIVVFPKGSKKKIDSSLKITKSIQKVGKIQAFESYSPFDSKKVLEWIADTAEQMDVKISKEASQKLFETIGTDLRTINSELYKLTTYVGKTKKIEKQDIEMLCSGIDNIFLLADLWIAGNTKQTLIELSKILDRDHPLKIMATLHTILTERLRIKLEIKAGTKSPELAQELGIHPYRLGIIINTLKNVSSDRLSALKNQLTLYEHKIKTGMIQPELGMEILMTM